MTSRRDDLSVELTELASQRIGRGEWPWSFFCYLEDRAQPVFPSSFRFLEPGGRGGRLGVAVRCPSCERTSVNLVSHAHVDVPFHNDTEIGVLELVLPGDAARLVDEFREDLYSSDFDTRRLGLG